MVNKRQGKAARTGASFERQPVGILLARIFSWGTVATTFIFLCNNYLTHWRLWPGPSAALHGVASGGGLALSLLQNGLYVAGVALAVFYVFRTPAGLLRPDSERIYAITAYIVRAAFWAVMLVGIADFVVSLLRIEGFLPGLFGDDIAVALNRPTFRGLYVHFPMVVAGLVIAIFRRGLGFEWLALLVVVAEMLIVLSRFIFSYEQAFMSDLVRFWYAPLFLFSSAYTLLEEGHVRVDVLYSVFADRTRGFVNAIGSVLLGMSLCWVIMGFGMAGRSSIINAPLLAFEVTPTGFGMFVKYWMAGFLGIFAATMLIQFAGYFLEGIADIRAEPGKRKLDTEVPVAQES